MNLHLKLSDESAIRLVAEESLRRVGLPLSAENLMNAMHGARMLRQASLEAGLTYWDDPVKPVDAGTEKPSIQQK